MSHEIEQYEDGTGSFAAAFTPGWHGLGTTVDHVMTISEALTLARLDWEVWLEPVLVGSTGQVIENCHAPVRTDPERPGQLITLGNRTVGKDFRPIQNAEGMAFLQHLVDDGEAGIHTAGALGQGQRVFVTMKLPRTLKIAGTDEVELYIAALNAHDGTKCFEVLASPVRVVCANTERAARASAVSKWSVRHTESAQGRIAAARETLGLANRYFDAFEELANQLADTSFTGAKMAQATERFFPLDKDAAKRTVTTVEGQREDVQSIYASNDTQATIRGTAWGAYNAFTYYLDHNRPVQTKNEADKRERRALAALVGSIDIQKDRALDAVMAVAK